MMGIVTAVFRSEQHNFSKAAADSILLIEGIGVEGDAHAGATVKHLSRVAKDPAQLNLRQVHLIHSELFDEVKAKGFSVAPGAMGENITTRNIDLLSLPQGARLHIGPQAVIEITGLRNPCRQIEEFQAGLMAAVLDKTQEGKLIRKAGIMGIVIASGTISPDDEIRAVLPPQPHLSLEPV